MQTAEPGVYAIGDIVLGTAATGARGRDGRHRRGGRSRASRASPSTPAHSELHLQPSGDRQRGPDRSAGEKQGYDVKVGKFPFTANSRASIVGAHDGFIKIVSDAEYGEILGVHIIGPHATEIIAEAVTAIELEATVEDLMWTIHAHPTVAEAMLDASNSVYGLAINA